MVACSTQFGLCATSKIPFTRHWWTKANNRGIVMPKCYAIEGLALFTREPVREGFEPSVAF
jgi:hypothetical protein